MRVLIVEDESSIANFICQGLTEAGYAVDVAADGQAGLAYALVADYDVLVLDIMLPGMDGLDLIRELRRQGVKAPTLMLTARDTVDDRVEGLDAGADDYLVKPFAFPELLARVPALLRRPALQAGTVLEVGTLKMDTSTREVRRGDRLIDLTPREYAVLEYLSAKRPAMKKLEHPHPSRLPCATLAGWLQIAGERLSDSS